LTLTLGQSSCSSHDYHESDQLAQLNLDRHGAGRRHSAGCDRHRWAGPTRRLVNGSHADQSHWRRVIAELGSDYRHITYDERARPGRGEIYGDPDPSNGDFDVDVLWSLVAT
jgi:hypothetical protein